MLQFFSCPSDIATWTISQHITPVWGLAGAGEQIDAKFHLGYQGMPERGKERKRTMALANVSPDKYFGKQVYSFLLSLVSPLFAMYIHCDHNLKAKNKSEIQLYLLFAQLYIVCHDLRKPVTIYQLPLLFHYMLLGSFGFDYGYENEYDYKIDFAVENQLFNNILFLTQYVLKTASDSKEYEYRVCRRVLRYKNLAVVFVLVAIVIPKALD